MQHVVMFSGGKDSLATLLTVKDTQPEFLVVFCDTGWEHPDTYKYLDYVEEMIGQSIIRVSNPKYPGGLAEQALKKKRFASMDARFCTEELKVQPGIDFILSLEDDVIVYQGVRNDESEARRMLKRNDEYFRFYFEPYKYVSKYQKQIKALLQRIGKAKSKPGQLSFDGTESFLELQTELRQLNQLHEQHKKPRFHSYRKRDIIAWSDKYSADVDRSVISWTAAEVIAYCLAKGFKLNPLYYRGAKRVGCYPCVNSTISEVVHIAQNDSWRINQIDYLEEALGDQGGTFFGFNKIPKRYWTGKITRDSGTHRVPLIRDVIKYGLEQRQQAELLDQQQKSGCISVYNICEI